jgi:hypothetical protein
MILIFSAIILFLVLISITQNFLVNYVEDKHYHQLFSSVKEEGNATINNIVNQTQIYNTSPIRLNKIATLITQNFSDPFWSYQQERFCYYPSNQAYYYCNPWYETPLYNLFDKNPTIYLYIVDKQGRVKIQGTNDLTNSPEWIAYQKTGTCQPISVLFNETVNRSGFVSQVVTAKGTDHAWDEIQINGSWKVFDVQDFGSDNGSVKSYYWNANPRDYYKTFNNSNLTVFTLDFQTNNYGEDVTQLYTQ